MGQDPGVIRAEIEQTRQRVGDEVDALSYKTDVGARTQDYLDEKKQAVKSTLAGAKDTVTAPLPDRRALKRGASYLRDSAESNPLGLALGGLAFGFIVGTLLPQTRVENERLGELSDAMDGRDYLEDRFTAGDLMMSAVLRILRHTEILQDFGALAAYRARCEARPAFRRAVDAQLKQFDKAA